MSNIVVYQDGELELKVSVDDNTVWLSAEDVAFIFNVKRPAIVKHIGNIYKDEELQENATCSILEQVAKDGKIRKINFYNLDMIIDNNEVYHIGASLKDLGNKVFAFSKIELNPNDILKRV